MVCHCFLTALVLNLRRQTLTPDLGQCICAGGVFEEAIAIATLLLDPDCAVAETVRIADLIDNTYQVRAVGAGKLAHSLNCSTTAPWKVI